MLKMRLSLTLLAVALCPSRSIYAEVFQPQLINGQPVAEGTFLEVVRLSLLAPDGSVRGYCTGTVIGSEVLATAAHCVDTDQRVSFTFKGVTYGGKGYQSPLFKTKDHDLAVVLTDTKLVDAKPMTVTFAPLNRKESVLLAGYGCTKKGGTGGNDGILRAGNAVVIGVAGTYDSLIDGGSLGAASCFGDSGGPTFQQTEGAPLQLAGIISKGDIKTLTLSVRHDLQDSKDFYADVERIYNTSICGLSPQGC